MNEKYMKPIKIFRKGDKDFPTSMKELSRYIIQEERKQKIDRLGWRG